MERAFAIREKALGPEHTDTALSLINLAVLYQTTGVHTKAEPLLERALAIREKALGPEHPDIALSLNVLAKLYQSTGAYAKAEPLFERALSIDESNTARFLLSGDEARKRAYFQAPRGNAYVDASFALARPTHAPGGAHGGAAVQGPGARRDGRQCRSAAPQRLTLRTRYS